MKAREMRRLPRLDPASYRGRAAVPWAIAMDARTTGWLDPLLHLRLRELLVHVCCRYRLICPAYVLMLDHGHFLLLGVEVREHEAFSAVAYYILENPVRAGLAEEFSRWEYSGCCVPGYPSLDPRAPGY